MANGTNSISEPPFPGHAGKSAFLVREQYIKAREYQDKIVARRRRSGQTAAARSCISKPWSKRCKGKRIVHHHTHRHDDIMTVLRLAQEFGLHVVLHHVSDGWKVADEIAAGQGALLGDRDRFARRQARSPRRSLRDRRHPGKSRRADRAFIPTTGSPIRAVFRRSAALAVRAGMSRAGGAQGADAGRRPRCSGCENRIGSLVARQRCRFRHSRKRSAERVLQDAARPGSRESRSSIAAIRPTIFTRWAAMGPATTSLPTCAASTMPISEVRNEPSAFRNVADLLFRRSRRLPVRPRSCRSPCEAKPSTPWPARRSKTAWSSFRTARSRRSAARTDRRSPRFSRAEARRGHARLDRRAQHGRLLRHPESCRTIKINSNILAPIQPELRASMLTTRKKI